MKVNPSGLFQHFHRSEYPFVERCLDWINQTLYNHQVIHTPFLDPREQTIIKSLVDREPELDLYVEGGIENAERCRGQLGRSDVMQYASPVPLSFLQVTPLSSKPLTHSQVLGGILGLGIRREQVGDIYPHVDCCHLIVTEEMSPFIQTHLVKIGKEKVRVEEIAKDQLKRTEPNWQTKKAILSSLRLDVVVAEGYRISRSRATRFIKSNDCKVNWKIEDKPDYPVSEGDYLSLRGYGRLRLHRIEKKTKKGKWLVRLEVLQALS